MRTTATGSTTQSTSRSLRISAGRRCCASCCGTEAEWSIGRRRKWTTLRTEVEAESWKRRSWRQPTSTPRTTHSWKGRGSIDHELLQHIMRMTRNLEVADRSAWEWNQALLGGFRVWRQLRAYAGGRVVGDLERGSLHFKPAADSAG